MMERKNRSGFFATCGGIITFSLALAIGFVSCSKEELVPEKTFYRILKDLHISKGILGFADVGDMFAECDSLAVYESIYEKYGYSREMVENTGR
jgi:hypothetical protein